GNTTTVPFTGPSCFSNGANNPLNYPVQNVLMGNGQGFFTEIPQFGFPAGGQFDTRFTWYVGDGWKATKHLSITYGVHYVRDTGRSDSDLPAIPALINSDLAWEMRFISRTRTFHRNWASPGM